MADLATLEQLTARTPGGIHGDDATAAANAALADVSALIRSEARRPLDATDLERLSDAQVAMLVMVTCASARRALANPDGLSQEQLGPYAAQQPNATPDVYLTANELRQVRRLRPTGGLSSMGVTRGPLETGRCAEASYLGTVYPDGTPGQEPIIYSDEPSGY